MSSWGETGAGWIGMSIYLVPCFVPGTYTPTLVPMMYGVLIPSQMYSYLVSAYLVSVISPPVTISTVYLHVSPGLDSIEKLFNAHPILQPRSIIDRPSSSPNARASSLQRASMPPRFCTLSVYIYYLAARYHANAILMTLLRMLWGYNGATLPANYLAMKPNEGNVQVLPGSLS